MKVKDNKSPGVDGIPPKLLKEIVKQISTPLAKLFNLSLEGIVPSEWNEANITPLFKKGSRKKPEMHQPEVRADVVAENIHVIRSTKFSCMWHLLSFFVYRDLRFD